MSRIAPLAPWKTAATGAEKAYPSGRGLAGFDTVRPRKYAMLSLAIMSGTRSSKVPSDIVSVPGTTQDSHLFVEHSPIMARRCFLHPMASGLLKKIYERPKQLADVMSSHHSIVLASVFRN